MTQVGFWQQLQVDARNLSLGSKLMGQISRPYFLFPQGDGPRGSFTTFAELALQLKSRDVVILGGVLREQAIAPLGVFDVTVLGAANTPRQATSSGTPTGGGATWMQPTSPTAATALIEVREQGWTFENIFFNPVDSSPAIQATRAESATYPDPSHLTIRGCRFGGGGTGQIGYEDSGGVSDVTIEDCEFYSLTTAIKGITGAGIATPLTNKYLRNFFHQNTNDIVIGCAYGVIQGNRHKLTTTQKVQLAAGSNETVVLNFFDDNAADIDPAHGYTGSTTGTWLNYVLNQAALQVGQPA